MGIYDRPYYSDQESTWSGGPLWNQRMVVTNLVLINAFFFLLNMLLGGKDNVITEAMTLGATDAVQPWKWWHLLSYAFAHSPESIWHIFWNMLGLWMLGRSVELHYGRAEFLRIYLAAAIFGGLVFMIQAYFVNPQRVVIGASGAVIAIELLFVLLNPKATLMIYGILPIPAWLFGIFLIAGNIFGGDPYVAYDVHLAGLAFAAIYFYSGINFGNLTENFSLQRLRRKLTGPRLKVLRPDQEVLDEQEADRILQKIHEKGQDSLSAKERRFMEKYSRKKREQRSRD